MLQHRHVMEQELGRKLRPGEIVHHKNENRADNRPENLELVSSQSEHISHHHGRKCEPGCTCGKHRRRRKESA